MNRAEILEFRNLVDRTPELHSRFLAACGQHPAAVAELARETGFNLSEQDVITAVNEIGASGDLTDLELELVSGGGQNGCQVGDPINTGAPRSGDASGGGATTGTSSK